MLKGILSSAQRTEYTLTPENVDVISQAIFDYCLKVNKKDHRQATACRLHSEEYLLTWLEALEEREEPPVLVLSRGKYRGKPYFSLRCPGKQLNPATDDYYKSGHAQSKIMVNLGLKPDYSYEDGQNYILYTLRKRRLNKMLVLLITLAAALACSELAVNFLSQDEINFVLNNLVSPLYDAFFNLLRCVAGPMVFLSVAWGIYGMGDTATMGGIGRKLIFRFVVIMLLATCCCAVFFPVLGPHMAEMTEDTMGAPGILKMFLDVIPSNVVSPFADGNTLQIIFLAFLVGFALLFLKKQAVTAANVINDLNVIFSHLMEIVSSLIPIFIFMVFLKLAWSGSLSFIHYMLTFMLITVGSLSGLVLFVVLFTSLRNRVNPIVLVRKVLPGFLLAISTGSSVASFSTITKACDSKLGVDKSVSGFGLPLGIVISRPGTGIYYVLLCFFFARVFEVDCTMVWIIVCILEACIITIATPPVPGGTAIAYTMMFAQLGIPEVALAWALAVDIIFDFLTTGANVAVLQMTMVNFSRGMKKLDLTKLRSKK